MQLAYLYWKNCGATAQFTEEFHRALQSIVRLWQREQRHDECSEYTFQRFDCPETDTLPCGGRGNPTAYTGMTWSGFRPSDDRCVYGYLVLSNMFAVVALGYMQQILSAFYRDPQYSPGPAAC